MSWFMNTFLVNCKNPKKYFPMVSYKKNTTGHDAHSFISFSTLHQVWIKYEFCLWLQLWFYEAMYFCTVVEDIQSLPVLEPPLTFFLWIFHLSTFMIWAFHSCILHVLVSYTSCTLLSNSSTNPNDFFFSISWILFLNLMSTESCLFAFFPVLFWTCYLLY